MKQESFLISTMTPQALVHLSLQRFASRQKLIAVNIAAQTAGLTGAESLPPYESNYMLICALKVRVDHMTTEKEGLPFKCTGDYSIISTLSLVINDHTTQKY